MSEKEIIRVKDAILLDDRRGQSRRVEGKVCPTTQPQRRNWVGRRTTPHNYFVGERERRKNKTLAENMDKHFSARRTKHNYDSPPLPKKLVYIKVEPEPHDGFTKLEFPACPYQKNDILELGEEWAEEYGCQYLTKDMDTSDPIQPASTCPSELCKKITVDKVIGVEEVVTPVFKEKVYPACGIACDRKWHWLILGDEI